MIAQNVLNDLKMENAMKGMIRKLGLLVLLPAMSLCGQNWFQGCCDCGEFSGGADLLIWTHTDCSYTYAEHLQNMLIPGDNSTPSVPPLITATSFDSIREYVKVGYEPGFRIHGRYDCDCSYVELSYLWFENTSSRVTNVPPSGPGTGPAGNPPVAFGSFIGEQEILTSRVFFMGAGITGPSARSISGRVRSRYQNVNLEGGREFASGCWGSAALYGNFRWVDIGHQRSTTAFFPEILGPNPNHTPPLVVNVPNPAGPNYDYRMDNTFWGVGLGCGISADFELCCGLHAGGKVGGTALIGDQAMHGTGRTFLRTIPRTLKVDHPSRTCFVPGVDLQLGLGYRCGWSCVSLAVDLAYELHYYPAALSFVGAATQDSLAHDAFIVGSIGYGGPSLKFTLGY